MIEIPPIKLLITSAFHCLIGCSGWYHYTSLNSLEPFVKSFTNRSIYHQYGKELTENQIAFLWSLVTTIFLIGGVIGSLSLHFLTEKFGRRATVMTIKNSTLVLGSLMMFLAFYCLSFELLLIGRLVCGMAATWTFFIPVFMAECAPTVHRGFCSAMCALGLNLWGVLGTVAGLSQVFGTAETWQYALILPVVPAFLHFIATPFLPESPKFLYIVREKQEKSSKAVHFYHGSKVDLIKIQQEYQNEMNTTVNEKSVGLVTILKKKYLRWPLLLGLASSISIAFDGSDIAYQYSTGIMMEQFSIEKAAIYTVLLVQVPSLIAAVIGMFLVEWCGRRPLFLIGLTVCTFGTISLFLSGLMAGSLASTLNVAGLVMILGGDSIGPSIIRTFLPGELCPQKGRSLSSAVQFIAEDTFSTLVTLYYPPASQLVGSYAILPFTILCTCTLFFLYMYLPETKNKTVDEVVSRWIDHNDALINTQNT